MSGRSRGFLPDARRLVDPPTDGPAPSRAGEGGAVTVFYRGALRNYADVERAFVELSDKAATFGWAAAMEIGEMFAALRISVPNEGEPMAFTVLPGGKYASCDGFFRCPAAFREEVFALLDVAEGFFTHFEAQDSQGLWNAHLRARSGAKRLSLRPLTDSEAAEIERGFDIPPLAGDCEEGFSARAFDPARRAELCAGFLRLVRKDLSDDLSAPIGWERALALAHAAHDAETYPNLGGYWHDVVVLIEYWANTCLRGRKGKPSRSRGRGVAPGYLLGWCLVEAMRDHSDSSFGGAHDRIERFRYDLHSKRWQMRSLNDFMRYAFSVMEYVGFVRSVEQCDRR